MVTYKDFASIYCCTTKTIYNKIRSILPILKNFDPRKRKRQFTNEEAKNVIKCIGLPPKNRDNRILREIFPDLYKTD